MYADRKPERYILLRVFTFTRDELPLRYVKSSLYTICVCVCVCPVIDGFIFIGPSDVGGIQKMFTVLRDYQRRGWHIGQRNESERVRRPKTMRVYK